MIVYLPSEKMELVHSLTKKTCIINISNLHKKIDRPFYISLTERSLNKGLPSNCSLINKVTKKINFSSEELVLAKLYKCS